MKTTIVKKERLQEKFNNFLNACKYLQEVQNSDKIDSDFISMITGGYFKYTNNGMFEVESENGSIYLKYNTEPFEGWEYVLWCPTEKDNNLHRYIDYSNMSMSEFKKLWQINQEIELFTLYLAEKIAYYLN